MFLHNNKLFYFRVINAAMPGFYSQDIYRSHLNQNLFSNPTLVF